MERIVAELAPDPATFRQHFALVQAYVESRPGAHGALMEAAHEDPEGMTTSIVALGAVLLDIAAGAFRLSPEQMLTKLAENVQNLSDASPA